MHSKISLFILLLMMTTSCSRKIKSSQESGETVETSKEITYLALGDSYTIGESVEVPQRWPVQLVAGLNKKGFHVTAPKIIAQTGWTTGDLLRAMGNELKGKKFDLVSVLIGVNNQYQGKSIAEYEEDLHIIFERAINHSTYGKDGVFVVSIPDYGATPFGASNAEEIEREIKKFNAVFKKVATAYKLPFYNITPISKYAKTQPGLVAEDGLHPSGKMYRLWVAEFIDEVVALLKT